MERVSNCLSHREENADAIAQVEHADAVAALAKASVSNSFFDELFPRKKVTPQVGFAYFVIVIGSCAT